MKVLNVLLCVLALPMALPASESTDLASGYAAAFVALNPYSASITYIGETQTEVLTKIRRVYSYGGVLLVQFDNGSSKVLDPARVERMSD